MGKRKHKDKDAHIRRKIRRLERRLRYRSGSSDSDYERRRDDSRSRSRDLSSERAPSHRVELDSDLEEAPSRPKSMVRRTEDGGNKANDEPIPSSIAQSDPNTAEVQPLPEDILQALGDPEKKEEVFGPKIPDEISERWGRVLVDGLTKDQKQEIMKKTMVPENFRLLKAPQLNAEIRPVLSDSVKNRDKLLEKDQNHLGLGIAGLASLTTEIIRGDLEKIETIKKLSEVSQIFLDLHHDNTNSRRKLIMASLDKHFPSVVCDVKRDALLFGANLGEKIKASKSAEKSGLQIRRNDASVPPGRKQPQHWGTGNWKAPPRAQGQRSYRPGGQKNRYTSRQNRRPPQAPDRPPAPPKASVKQQKT